jgi:hypothetical protein
MTPSQAAIVKPGLNLAPTTKTSPVRSDGSRVPTPSLQWHRVMTAALRYSWTSLVVVPASRGISSLAVAQALTDAVGYYRPTPGELIDATGVTATSVGRVLERVTLSDRGLLIISLESFLDNPASIPIALAAQAALLCVTLGQTDTASATETLELIRDKTIGSVVLRPRRGK